MILDFSKEIDFNSFEIANDYERKVVSFVKDWFSGKEKFEIQTSGSTGKPKIISVERFRMIHSAKMTCSFLELKKRDSSLLCLPVEYISGMMMIVRSIVSGLKMYVKEPSLQPLKDLDHEIDFCAMTPLQVQNSLDKISWIKKLIIGGAEVSNQLRAELEKSPHQIFETYGMTETLSHIALKKISPEHQEYFEALLNVSISKDQRDCLVIDAPQLSPQKIVTNDVVDLVDENKFKFLGRADNIINSGGVKIIPEKVEGFIKNYINIEVVLLGKKDEILGNKLVLLVEGEEDENLRKKINQLPYERKYLRPKEIVFVEKFFRTENGKIQREFNKSYVK